MPRRGRSIGSTSTRRSESDAHDIEQAEACVTKVFELNPDSAAGHALLGMVRQAQGRPVEAVASYTRALAIDPSNMYALGELGRMYGQLGRDRDSAAMMERASSEDPLSTIQHHGYLWSALMSGNHGVVLQDAPRVLRSAPEFALVRWDLSVALIQEDRLDEARAVLDAAPAERVPTIAGRLCVFMNLALEGKHAEALTSVGDHLLTCARHVEYPGHGSSPSATRASAIVTTPSTGSRTRRGEALCTIRTCRKAGRSDRSTVTRGSRTSVVE